MVNDDVPLRYSRRATVWLLRQFVLSLVACTVGGGFVDVARHEGTFLVGVYIGLGIWAVFWALLLPAQRNTWYRIRGDSLVGRGSRWVAVRE